MNIGIHHFGYKPPTLPIIVIDHRLASSTLVFFSYFCKSLPFSSFHSNPFVYVSHLANIQTTFIEEKLGLPPQSSSRSYRHYLWIP